MAVKGPTARRESADFPTNLRECTTLIVLLHSHCSTKGACGSDALSCPAQRWLLCFPSRQPGGSRTTCSPPTALPFPRPKSAVLILPGLCQSLWLLYFAVYRKFYQSTTDLSSANYRVKYIIKHFLK